MSKEREDVGGDSKLLLLERARTMCLGVAARVDTERGLRGGSLRRKGLCGALWVWERGGRWVEGLGREFAGIDGMGIGAGLPARAISPRYFIVATWQASRRTMSGLRDSGRYAWRRADRSSSAGLGESDTLSGRCGCGTLTP